MGFAEQEVRILSIMAVGKILVESSPRCATAVQLLKFSPGILVKRKVCANIQAVERIGANSNYIESTGSC